VLDGYREHTRAPSGAGQILAPWPNRLRDGRYAFEGRQHQLVLTEPSAGNAIHGLVRWLPWQRVAHQESAVTVTCRIPDQPGYPFRVQLTTTWSLGEDGLRVEHSAESIGEVAAPFGLGVHPYLVIPGVDVDDLILTVPAEHVLLADERGLPTEQAKVAGTNLDFRNGDKIGTRRLDHAFTSLIDDRTVRISAQGSTVELWLGTTFPWTQVFTGDTIAGRRKRRSVAVEPMTCPADAFNSGTDLIRLEPGRGWRGIWGSRLLA
jgi:aldose 1-epimerase